MIAPQSLLRAFILSAATVRGQSSDSPGKNATVRGQSSDSPGKNALDQHNQPTQHNPDKTRTGADAGFSEFWNGYLAASARAGDTISYFLWGVP
jgi:hypothetical protein